SAAAPGSARRRHAMTVVSRAEPNPVPRRYGALALRFASGVVLVPFLLGVAYFGDRGPLNDSGVGLAYGVLICAACVYAAFELRGMLRAGGFAPLDLTLVGLSIALPLDAWLRPGQDIASDG